MVAPNHGIERFPRPIYDSVRVGPITCKVSATDDSVIFPSGVGEDGLQRLQIAVEVAEDEISQLIRLFATGSMLFPAVRRFLPASQ